MTKQFQAHYLMCWRAMFASLSLSILLLIPLPASADFETGMRAFDRGDYVEAYKEWHALAAAGDAEAQYWMGRLLPVMLGQESPPNTVLEAIVMFHELAARQGHSIAQGSLSFFYPSIADPDANEKAVAWGIQSLISSKGQESGGILALVRAYCHGPDYLRNIEFALAWDMILNPDPAFNRTPEVLDQEWEAVRAHWESVSCFKSVRLTKDQVRRAHRRALALAEAYDLETTCHIHANCDGD